MWFRSTQIINKKFQKTKYVESRNNWLPDLFGITSSTNWGFSIVGRSPVSIIGLLIPFRNPLFCDMNDDIRVGKWTSNTSLLFFNGLGLSNVAVVVFTVVVFNWEISASLVIVVVEVDVVEVVDIVEMWFVGNCRSTATNWNWELNE